MNKHDSMVIAEILSTLTVLEIVDLELFIELLTDMSDLVHENERLGLSDLSEIFNNILS